MVSSLLRLTYKLRQELSRFLSQHYQSQTMLLISLGIYINEFKLNSSKLDLVHSTPENLKTEFSLCKRHQML